jgi:thiol:disulfide interchange protein
MISKRRNCCLRRATLLLTLGLGLLMINKSNAQNTEDQLVKYDIKKPEEVRPGKQFKIDVLFSVQPEWYIYAPTGINAADGMIETKIIFQLPEGITRSGKMKLPKAVYKNGHEVYEGTNITMSQTLLVSPSLQPGEYEIRVRITWQSCNSVICLQPVTEEVTASIKINKRA